MHEGIFFADFLWREKIKTAQALHENNFLHIEWD